MASRTIAFTHTRAAPIAPLPRPRPVPAPSVPLLRPIHTKCRKLSQIDTITVRGWILLTVASGRLMVLEERRITPPAQQSKCTCVVITMDVLELTGGRCTDCSAIL